MLGITINGLNYRLTDCNIGNASTYIQWDVYNGETRSGSAALTVPTTITMCRVEAYRAILASIGSSAAVPADVDAELFQEVDYTALDSACQDFREACASVEPYLPEAFRRPYRGSFEEVKEAAPYIPVDAAGQLVRDLFNLANQQRNNEAVKSGMTESQGWWYCWGLTP